MTSSMHVIVHALKSMLMRPLPLPDIPILRRLSSHLQCHQTQGWAKREGTEMSQEGRNREETGTGQEGRNRGWAKRKGTGMGQERRHRDEPRGKKQGMGQETRHRDGPREKAGSQGEGAHKINGRDSVRRGFRGAPLSGCILGIQCL